MRKTLLFLLISVAGCWQSDGGIELFTNSCPFDSQSVCNDQERQLAFVESMVDVVSYVGFPVCVCSLEDTSGVVGGWSSREAPDSVLATSNSLKVESASGICRANQDCSSFKITPNVSSVDQVSAEPINAIMVTSSLGDNYFFSVVSVANAAGEWTISFDDGTALVTTLTQQGRRLYNDQTSQSVGGVQDRTFNLDERKGVSLSGIFKSRNTASGAYVRSNGTSGSWNGVVLR